MPKQFYTELDIEEMAKRGVTSLDLNDDVVLTELAYETARRLGVQLGKGEPASPSAPLRPYLSKFPNSPAPKPAANGSSAPAHQPAAAPSLPQAAGVGTPCAFCTGGKKPGIQVEELRQRVRKAAIAKMGERMDAALIDTIIERVFDNIGLK